MLKFHKCLYEFANLLQKNCYIVGGFVRDSLLGKKPSDVDVCSQVKVENLTEILKGTNFCVKSYTKFQTAKIEYNNLKEIYNFEYSCFRKDFYSHKNGHTPLKIRCVKNLKTDAKRRDFTINCIYFDIKNNKFIDPKKGIKHLKKGIIKTVLAPQKTLKFDGERLLRLLKLKAITNFEIDKKTLKFALKNKQNLNFLTKNLKQKYLVFFNNLPFKIKQNLSDLFKIFNIEIN